MELDRAKGTRDFEPQEELFRNKTIETIRRVFEKYGFLPFETPIIERYDVMTAKFAAGEEADSTKEIFKLTDQGGRKLGLRYEFTFPLARYIAMNPKIKLPFKRYQIGPIFRDGPLKPGRYREFYQCDVDTVGVKSLLADAECIAAVTEILRDLGIPSVVKVSSRKFLQELLTKCGVAPENQTGVIISIDKLEKMGPAGVKEELTQKGVNPGQSGQILKLLDVFGTNEQKLEVYKKTLGTSPAMQELEELFGWLKAQNVEYQFTPSLARGLGYYTGPIFEFFAKDSRITSSIAAGGRWDAMIGNYIGKPDQPFPATGASIGLEPVFDVLREKNVAMPKSTTQLFLIPMKTEKECLNLLAELRTRGVNAGMDFMGRSLSKNLEYVSSQSIPFAAIVGSNELAQNKMMLRDMESGKQELVTVEESIVRLKR